MHMSISMEACLFNVCIFTQTDINLTHASFTGKQSTENTVAKCFPSVKKPGDRGGICVGFDSKQRETADGWRSAVNQASFWHDGDGHGQGGAVSVRPQQ